jgi:hypothetical protein
MNMSKIAVWAEPEDVDTALARLGLAVAPLQRAVRSGYLSRIARTANDAPIAAGFYQWNDTLRALRDELVLLGWSRVDEQGFSTALSPDGSIAIAVSSGDEATGTVRGFPRTKRDKGPRTADAINANVAQLDLFPETIVRPAISEECLTYVLLFYSGRNELRAELSLPVSLDERDHINSWRERIILPMQPIDPEGAVMPKPDFSPEIDIDVQRRA